MRVAVSLNVYILQKTEKTGFFSLFSLFYLKNERKKPVKALELFCIYKNQLKKLFILLWKIQSDKNHFVFNYLNVFVY